MIIEVNDEITVVISTPDGVKTPYDEYLGPSIASQGKDDITETGTTGP